MEVALGKRILNRALFLIPGVLACTILRAGTVYFESPYVADIDHYLSVAPKSLPQGEFELIQWPPNPTSGSGDVAADWDVGMFTGFTPAAPAEAHQRGVSRYAVGSTAVQAAGNRVGFLIDSASLITPKTLSGTLLPIVAQYLFPSASQFKPFVQPGNTLVFAMQAQLPHASGEGTCGRGESACAYATMYFGVVDATTGLEFWYGAALYDTRGTPFGLGYVGETVTYDRSTQRAIVGGVVNLSAAQGARFTITLPTSQGFQSQSWAGYKPFQFAISATNMKNAIGRIKALFPGQYGRLSADPANYRISQMNFNPEVAYFGGKASIGVAFSNIRISVQDNSDCYNTYNGVDDVVGLTNGDVRFLCHNQRWYDCGFSKNVEWSIHASQGERVGEHICEIRRAAWVD